MTPGTREAGSTMGPKASSDTPLQRWAVTGAKTSRPANVPPGEARWYAGSVSSTARPGPPAIATAGAIRPLSGATTTPAPPATSTATARRAVPTPGSTTAMTTPAGTYWMQRASARDPARMSWGGMSWVRSITVT